MWGREHVGYVTVCVWTKENECSSWVEAPYAHYNGLFCRREHGDVTKNSIRFAIILIVNDANRRRITGILSCLRCSLHPAVAAYTTSLSSWSLNSPDEFACDCRRHRGI